MLVLMRCATCGYEGEYEVGTTRWLSGHAATGACPNAAPRPAPLPMGVAQAELSTHAGARGIGEQIRKIEARLDRLESRGHNLPGGVVLRDPEQPNPAGASALAGTLREIADHMSAPVPSDETAEIAAELRALAVFVDDRVGGDEWQKRHPNRNIAEFRGNAKVQKLYALAKRVAALHPTNPSVQAAAQAMDATTAALQKPAIPADPSPAGDEHEPI